MEKQELDKQESNVEDLTVNEDTAAEVKGGFAGDQIFTYDLKAAKK